MKTVLLLCAVLAGSPHAHAGDQAAGSGRRGANTWEARSSSGLTLGGTWTATEDQKAGTVTGTWTLLDGQRQTTTSGAWGAAKSPSGWTGSWRAAAAGRPGEYSGTWTAAVDLKGGAGFADLFSRAAQSAVSGTWRAGRQAGAWTIQVGQ